MHIILVVSSIITGYTGADVQANEHLRSAALALMGAINDATPEMRLRAVRGVQTIGPYAKDVLATLVASLKFGKRVEDIEWDKEVLQALAEAGPAAKTFTPILIEMLGDRYRGRCAATALISIRPDGTDVNNLCQLATNGTRSEVSMALEVLSTCPEYANRIVPLATARIESEHGGRCRYVLEQMGPKAVPLIVKQLENANESQRQLLIGCVGRIAGEVIHLPKAEIIATVDHFAAAEKALREAVNSESEWTRRTAQVVLEEIVYLRTIAVMQDGPPRDPK